MLYEELSSIIINCAFAVYNRLGSGFLESVYHKCMLIELEKAGCSVVSQVPLDVYYDGRLVGQFKADMLVNDLVIVELKAVDSLVKAHEVQLVNYLACADKELGLLLNFGSDGVLVRRREKVNPHRRK